MEIRVYRESFNGIAEKWWNETFHCFGKSLERVVARVRSIVVYVIFNRNSCIPPIMVLLKRLIFEIH